MTDHKAYIIEALDLLRKKETQSKNVFKARAYAKVISELQSYDKPIQTIDDVKELTGVGAKIREKIVEILGTGKLQAAEDIKSDVTVNIREALLKIYGVGPVKAKDIVEKHNISSIADLRALYQKDPSILNDKQTIGLMYYEDINERIPRDEMESHKKVIMDAIRSTHADFQAEIVGSYRRGAKDSGDIDVLMTLPTDTEESRTAQLFADVVRRLGEQQGYIVETLAKGPTKFMGICKLSLASKGRRLDLLMTRAEEYPYAVLYFTGSDKFNVAMRKHALDLGYTMNEHGMKVAKEGSEQREPQVRPPPNMKSEKDIFDFLNLQYVSPESRVDGKSLRKK